MEKGLRIYNFLKKMLWKDEEEERNRFKSNDNLTERFTIRVSKKEAEMIKSYCSLREFSNNEFFRVAAYNEVGRFIIESDAENQYYDSLNKKTKLKKVV